jgi:hypothetical protein
MMVAIHLTPTRRVAPSPWRSGGSMTVAIPSEPGSMMLAIGTDASLNCVGYYLTRFIEPEDSLAQGLLPSRIVTVSDCLTDLLPDVWTFAWTKCPDDARANSASRMGVSIADLPSLSVELDGLVEQGRLGFPTFRLHGLIRKALELSRALPVVTERTPFWLVWAFLGRTWTSC